MDVFDLLAKISLDTSAYENSLSDAESKTSSFGSSLKTGLSTAASVGATAVVALGTTVVAGTKALVSGVQATAQYGDEIDKTSQKLGLSTDAYQKWDYVLNLAGTEMASMTTGLKTLTNKIDDAKNGSEDAQAMFAKLGISMDDLATMSREDIFEATIYGFQQMEDSTERAALANDLYGKSGQNLTPLFNQTAEATQEQIKLAEEYGMVMSGDMVKASAGFQDALTTVQGTVTGLKNKFMGELLPSFTDVLDGFSALVSGSDESGEQFAEGIESAIDSITDMLPRLVTVGGKLVISLANGIVKNLPFDTIKIDRSFVLKLEEDDKEKELIGHFTGVANTFGAKVCVEGIETTGMRDILQNYNVQSFQGYYYSKPMVIEDFLAWADKR